MPSRPPAGTSSLELVDQVEHPFWCDPRHCQPIMAGREHRSIPVVWEASHDEVELSLARMCFHERNADGIETADEGWLFTIRNTGVEESASVMLCSDHDLDMIMVARFKLRTMLAGGEIVDTTSGE
jgi:hypothetical protein